MTKQFLIGLISTQRTFDLFLLFLASLFTVSVSFRFGVRLLKLKLSPLHVHTSILFLALYSVVARLFLPAIIVSLSFAILAGICLSLNQKLILKALGKGLGTGLIIVILNMLGDFLIAAFCMIDQRIFEFIFKTTLGLVIGILTETTAPLIFLLMKKEVIFPGLEQIKDFYPYIMIYTAICYTTLDSLIAFFYDKTLQLHNFIMICFIIGGGLGGHLLTIRKERQKQEEIKHNHESQVNAIVDRFDELKNYESINRPIIKKLVKRELSASIRRHAMAFDLAQYVLEDIEKNS